MLKFKEFKSLTNSFHTEEFSFINDVISDDKIAPITEERVKYAMGVISRSLGQLQQNFKSFLFYSSKPEPLIIFDFYKDPSISLDLLIAASIFKEKTVDAPFWNKEIQLKKVLYFDAKSTPVCSQFITAGNSIEDFGKKIDFMKFVTDDMLVINKFSPSNDTYSKSVDDNEHSRWKQLQTENQKKLKEYFGSKYQHKVVSKKNLNKLFSTIGFEAFPEDIAARVKYSMAWACKCILQANDTICPENPLILEENDFEKVRYLWTALIILGKKYEPRFNYKSIKIMIDEFNPVDELGFIIGFRKSSLYETEFKFHLKPEMYEISHSAALYEDSTDYLGIQAQHAEKRKRLITELLQEFRCNQYSSDDLNTLPPKIVHSSFKKSRREIKKRHAGLEQPNKDFFSQKSMNSNFEISYIINPKKNILKKPRPIKRKPKNISEDTVSVFNGKSSERPIDSLQYLYNMGKSFEEKTDNENLLKACEYYSMAVLKNHMVSCNALERLAKNGLAEAQYILGVHWFHRQNNFIEAIQWCFSSALQEHPKAISYLLDTEFTAKYYMHIAGMFEEQKQPEKHLTSLITIYKKAARLDDREAAFRLGQLYQMNSSDFKKDLSLSFDAFLQAAKLGHPDALIPLERLAGNAGPSQQSALGQIYCSFFSNPQKASYWQTRAAESKKFSI